MKDALQNTIEITKSGAPIVSDETVEVEASTSPKKGTVPSLADYVKRVKNMKNGISTDCVEIKSTSTDSKSTSSKPNNF